MAGVTVKDFGEPDEEGTFSVPHEDGTYEEFKAGDAYEILPGHTGSVVGDEVAVAYEFSPETAATYGKEE